MTAPTIRPSVLRNLEERAFVALLALDEILHGQTPEDLKDCYDRLEAALKAYWDAGGPKHPTPDQQSEWA